MCNMIMKRGRHTRRNITLSIKEDLLQAGRQYAKNHHTSLNDLVRDLLAKTVMKSRQSHWLDECFNLMSKAKGHSHGKKWRREDLYDV